MSGTKIPAIGTLTVPGMSPTSTHHTSQKVGVIVGSICAAVVVLAIIVSLVCYLKFRGKGGGGPRADHSPRKSIRADLDLSTGGVESSGVVYGFEQAPQPSALYSGGAVGGPTTGEGAVTSASSRPGEGYGGQNLPAGAGFGSSYPSPYIRPPQTSPAPAYYQPTTTPTSFQGRSSDHGQPSAPSTPPTTWTNSSRQRERSGLTIDTLGTSSSSSISSRQSIAGGVSLTDPVNASQSSIDKPWMNPPYGPYAGLARQAKPRRAPRTPRPSYLNTLTPETTQYLTSPPREEMSGQDPTASSVPPATSPPQRRSRPLPNIPGTASSSPPPAQISAVPPPVLAQPSARLPPTMARYSFDVETGSPSSNEPPPSYYRMERSRLREPAS
ncbi:hypothetical protein FRC01_006613 [Tulasnella sp. 417]|nr:hypothetical protein FRC01_006613 [Tulasnella sp. 417]